VATVQALLAETRARSAELNEARLQLEKAKAKALKLRTAREAGELAPLSEWRDAITIVTGKMVAALVGLPARFTRDIAERARLEGVIGALRSDVSNWLEAEAARLEQAARKSARRRA
jgi:hypothetical protein